MASPTIPPLHKKEYKVIEEESGEELARQVEAALQEGWKLAGGVAVFGSTRFLQAVSRG
jgi:hypothetical protein